MKLSKAGYGNIEIVSNLDVETFLNLIHYENYIAEYNNVFREINRGDRKQ